MLRFTIGIPSHVLTHHHLNSLSVQPLHIIQRGNTSVHVLIVINYTATIFTLPPRLPTSPPFRNTRPFTSFPYSRTFTPSTLVPSQRYDRRHYSTCRLGSTWAIMVWHQSVYRNGHRWARQLIIYPRQYSGCMITWGLSQWTHYRPTEAWCDICSRSDTEEGSETGSWSGKHTTGIIWQSNWIVPHTSQVLRIMKSM